MNLLNQDKRFNMMYVTLEPVDNGVMKIIEDDNINAAGEKYEAKIAYDLENGGLNRTAQFFNDLVLDLGIDVGSDEDQNKLEIKIDWGVNYKPKQEELKIKIAQLEKALTHYKSLQVK